MYLPPPAWYVILFFKVLKGRVVIVVCFHEFLFWPGAIYIQKDMPICWDSGIIYIWLGESRK